MSEQGERVENPTPCHKCGTTIGVTGGYCDKCYPYDRATDEWKLLVETHTTPAENKADAEAERYLNSRPTP